MGRRKIEIKAIKDDRNRSVTFLKRKQGLFKKAHELSVLCSVDVAVIVFGQNKKLYEYSSGDINQTLSRYQYYGMAHEHKGPADFADRGGGDDDDDDDENIGSDQPETASPPHHGIVPHPIQSQPGLQHVTHSTPSASPPMPNGMLHPRMGTPPQAGSRPASRTHIRRQSSNLVPQDHPQPQASQPMPGHMGYGAYHAPQSSYYHPHATAPPQMHGHQQHATPPMQHHHYTHPPPQQQMQHLYLQEQRRQAITPNAPPHTHPSHEQAQHVSNMPTPPQPSRPFQSPGLPEPPLSHGQQGYHHPFGHPDDRASQMMQHHQHQQQQQHQQTQQHWHAPPTADLSFRNHPQTRVEEGPRSQSIDVGAAMRHHEGGQPIQARYGPPNSNASPRPALRTISISGASIPEPLPSASSIQSDAKRPRLTVQIPGEAAENTGSATAESSSPRETAKTSGTTPAKGGATESSHSSGMVLPAPSPRSASAGAVLSAGATGPTNPFARPNIPTNKQNSNADSWRDNMASPMSALPSRVMAEGGYMSSPSSMFPELGFGSMGGNNLASPAVYQPTPIQTHGPSFRDDSVGKRRKSADESDEGPKKRSKS